MLQTANNTTSPNYAATNADKGADGGASPNTASNGAIYVTIGGNTISYTASSNNLFTIPTQGTYSL